MKNGAYYSGTSGLVLPVPKRLFPPKHKDKSLLEYYATLFNTLEVNSSFYRLPMAKTVEKWTAAVPENFKFTYKLLRDITHSKGFAYEPAVVARCMQTFAGAGDKAGCLLVQLPPSVTINKIDEVATLLAQVQAAAGNTIWTVAVEFRHSSWYCDEAYVMLQSCNAVLVQHDMPGSDTPSDAYANDTVYMRFHGTEKGYRGSYTDDALAHYAACIKAWLKEERTVYAYFNNTLGGALANLQTLNGMVGE